MPRLGLRGTSRLESRYMVDCGAGAMVAGDCSGGIDAGAMVAGDCPGGTDASVVCSIVVGVADGCETWVSDAKDGSGAGPADDTTAGPGPTDEIGARPHPTDDTDPGPTDDTGAGPGLTDDTGAGPGPTDDTGAGSKDDSGTTLII